MTDTTKGPNTQPAQPRKPRAFERPRLRVTAESSDAEVAYYLGQYLQVEGVLAALGSIGVSALEQAYDRLNARAHLAPAPVNTAQPAGSDEIAALKTADDFAARFMTSIACAGVVPQEYSNDALAEMYFQATKLRIQIKKINEKSQ